jgi:hypothetical protein
MPSPPYAAVIRFIAALESMEMQNGKFGLLRPTGEKTMVRVASVFEKTYRHYLDRLAGVEAVQAAPRIGGRLEAGQIIVPLLGDAYRIADTGIYGPDGQRPPLGICVVLCQYVLMAPGSKQGSREWVAYRDFKEAAPLVGYFTANCQGAIIQTFAGRVKALERAAARLGAKPLEAELSYSLALRFEALPFVPLFMLFNEGDDEFGPSCSVLFERCAENFLDMECLAILGAILAERLTTCDRR